MLLNDNEIKKLAEKGMIKPFLDHKVKNVLSYGLEPFGYTIRLEKIFKSFNPKKIRIVDPKNVETKDLIITKNSEFIILYPNTTILGQSLEYFKMPPAITAFGTIKSSYSRLGIFANITTIDAGWEGYLTLSLSNLSSYPVKIYPNLGIAQLHFVLGDIPLKTYLGKFHKLKDIKI